MKRKGFCQIWTRFCITAVVLIGLLGCESSPQELSPAAPAGKPEDPLNTAFAAPGGRVLASRELGMEVTGEGAGEPERSLAVVERRIVTFLPQLEKAYVRERQQDPTLLGSLGVVMTLQPDGRVSDARFPQQRVSSEKLVSAVFDQIREWRFSPADNVVQVRYTLLFVPTGVDLASIAFWEQQLSNRAALAPSVEHAAELVEPVVPVPTPVPAYKEESQTSVPTPRPSDADESPTRQAFVAGWYRVTRPSALYAAPRSAAAVVNRLRPGMLVHVINVAADGWLEVRSVTDRPPGFLRHEDVVLESRERGGA